MKHEDGMAATGIKATAGRPEVFTFRADLGKCGVGGELPTG
jgi:hypothetical protein